MINFPLGEGDRREYFDSFRSLQNICFNLPMMEGFTPDLDYVTEIDYEKDWLCSLFKSLLNSVMCIVLERGEVLSVTLD